MSESNARAELAAAVNAAEAETADQGGGLGFAKAADYRAMTARRALAEHDAQLRAYALAQATELEAKAEALWEDLKRVETEAKPHMKRLEEATWLWHQASMKARQLREMFPEENRTIPNTNALH